jgi:DNA/RNA endonuclease YhcR with UshA esterase domain
LVFATTHQNSALIYKYMYLKYQNFYITIISIIFFVLLVFINTAQANNLSFTEIMYNPEGTDTDQEWVEVFNLSTSTIEINSDWRFNDGSNHLLNLYQGNNQIATSTFFIITSDAQVFLNNYQNFNKTIFESVLSLSNSTDTLQLLNNNQLITEFTYNSELGANGNGKTLEKINIHNSENAWQESYIINGTPGNESSTPPLNQAPIAIAGENIIANLNEEITFDASNSSDPDDDELNFLWNFAELASSSLEIATYQFSEIGSYLITLTVSDGQTSSTDSLTVIIEEEEIDNPPITIIDNIIINELLPNPEGSDDAEWIELKNENNDSINLEGCYLEDASGNRYTFSTTDFNDLNIDNYFVLERSVSRISLNNFDETISLFNNLDEKMDEFTYSDSQENHSWAKFNNQWKKTSLLTKGYQNQEEIIHPPIAIIDLLNDKLNIDQEIILNAENSEDPNGQNLEYKWYLNNSLKENNKKFQITFTTTGLKKIKLKVINESELENEATIYLYINDSEEDLEKPGEICSGVNKEIIINEILPNPEGSDDAEWIELYNPNNQDINLDNWTINDITSSFTINKIIKTHDYLLIKRNESKITLNNSNEELRLLDCQNNLINELSYSKSFEGQSYAYDIINKEYFWTENVSPTQKNIFSFSENNTFSLEDISVPTEETEINFIEIEEISNLEKNKEVLISGIVVATPNELYKNTAFICYYNTDYKLSDLNECTAIYLNKKWPSLNYGDLIQAQGKINHLKNYSRIKITNPDNITIIRQNIPFDLAEYYIEEIDKDAIDSFISISGQINKLNKKSFYIIDDENELKIKINNHQIELNEFSKNDFITITGLLTQYNDDLVFIPRNQKDLTKSKILGDKEEMTISNSSTKTEIIDLNKESHKTNTTNLLLGSGIITSLGFIFKNKFIQLFKK